MPKTLSQAGKKLAHEQRIQEKAQQRIEDKKVRDLALKKKAEEEREPVILPVTKKALKKGQKAAEKLEREAPAEEKVLDDAPPNSSYAEILSAIMIPERSPSLPRLAMAISMAAAKADKEAENVAAEPARLVENHSTYCEGLRPVLIRLGKSLPGCTIIPGKISGGESRYETFALHFQRAIDSNTYKFVARNGGTAQDVTISVPNAEEFTEEVVCERVEQVISALTHSRIEAAERDLPLIPLSNYNRHLAAERGNAWKTTHHDRHQKKIAKEKQIKEEDQVKIFSRTLKTKGLPAEEVEACAVRDVKIVSGENRGKYSMR